MTEEVKRDATSIGLRPAEASDDDFLFGVYASSRAQEMALVPWDEAQKRAFLLMQFNAQSQFYAQKFVGAQHLVILSDGRAIGRLYISREPLLIRILDITILPEERSRGIGTHIIQAILDEGRETRRPVQIYVESFNPSLSLFERLGFTRKEEEGFNLLLEKQF